MVAGFLSFERLLYHPVSYLEDSGKRVGVFLQDCFFSVHQIQLGHGVGSLDARSSNQVPKTPGDPVAATRLEDQFERELHLSRGAGRAADQAKASAADNVRGKPEINQVEDIEKFGAQLQRYRLGCAPMAEGSVLNQRYVEVVECRPA